MASPSHYRREGRKAYYRGGDPIEACPYNDSSANWTAQFHRGDWLEGWEQAKAADIDVPAVIDYEDVLRRYIDHVGQSEGANYINCLNDHTRSDVTFSQDEVEALERLAS